MADDQSSLHDRIDAAFCALVKSDGENAFDQVTFWVAYEAGFNAAMRDAYTTISRQHAAAHAKSMPILEALNAGNAAFIEAMDTIERDAGIECLGSCETCSEPLFSGDTGYHDTSNGFYLCSEHAPTYQDWKHAAEKGFDVYENAEERRRALKLIQNYLDDGGSLTDNILQVVA